MTNRRGQIVAAISAAIMLLAVVLMVGQLRAQPPGGTPPAEMPGAGGMAPPMDMGSMGPGMMGPDMGMGMPGMGAGAGQPLQWSESEMPEELTMTYDQFIAETGEARAGIPGVYLKDDEGKDIKRTRNSWWQLHRIYAAELAVAGERPKGTPGGSLEADVLKEYAAKDNEVAMVRRVYKSCQDLFSFEMSAPVANGGDSAHSNGSFGCAVVMRVKQNNVRRLLKTIEKEFSRFSHYGMRPGEGRRAYKLVTYERGVWRPKFYWLSDEALNEWDRLWRSHQLRVRAYGTDGEVLAEASLNLGHSGATPGELLYPPDIKTGLIAQEQWLLDVQRLGARRGFDGGPGINWNVPHGWIYAWTVSGPTADLSRVDAAEAAFVVADGEIGSRRVFGGLVQKGAKFAAFAPDALPLTSSLGPFAGDLLAGGVGARPAAGGPGMGMPGEMGGMPGMPGEMGSMPPGMPGPGSMPIGPGYAPEVPPTAALMPGI